MTELSGNTIRRHRRSLLARLSWLRQRVFSRGNEIGFLLLAIMVGALAGCVVSAVSFLAHLLHSLLFGVPFAAGLSGSALPKQAS